MTVETATTLAELVDTLPAETDPIAEGGAHLRLIKAVFYVAVMHFKQVRDSGVLDTLNWSSRAIAYLTLYVGLVLDFLLNMLMSIPFVELPEELLTTTRIRRHKFDPSDKLLFGLITSAWMQAYRYKLALAFCRNYLAPFDKAHCE